MSRSQTIVITGCLAENHIISGCGSSSISRKSASGPLCFWNIKWNDGKCPVYEFYYDSSHCVYCIEIQTEYTFKHNTLMPYNMLYFVFEVQYMCHISDIFVTDFQTYDLSF